MEDGRWERRHGENYLMWWLVAKRMGANGFYGFADSEVMVAIE
jgi:hypothetical protein